ncbi:MAG: TauD/TfdA family dioxygenase [Myxococcales bacterium]|jgi:gamma-butyrobetaine dioxygenase|nr:TauD/TfdA family dioxygenase [Myxococcales bacterium]
MSPPHEALRARLAVDGFAVVTLEDRAFERMLQPWLLVDGLLGLGPQLTEVQPIRPIAQGRSFAASSGPAPLHTDSQLWRGRPAELQLTCCLRPAERDGESVLVDGFALADRLAAACPADLARLLDEPRCLPFVFGHAFGPTLARRGDRHVFTHPARPHPGDRVAPIVARALAEVPQRIVRLEGGQALLVDNHRMLHGRRAFDDPHRELLRVLAWLEAPLSPRPAWADTADRVHAELAARLGDAPLEVRHAFGLEPAAMAAIDAAVTAMLSGAPPGALARRLGIDEAALYRHRDRLATTGRPDLAQGGDPLPACLEVLARLRPA